MIEDDSEFIEKALIENASHIIIHCKMLAIHCLDSLESDTDTTIEFHRYEVRDRMEEIKVNMGRMEELLDNV